MKVDIATFSAVASTTFTETGEGDCFATVINGTYVYIGTSNDGSSVVKVVQFDMSSFTRIKAVETQPAFGEYILRAPFGPLGGYFYMASAIDPQSSIVKFFP